MWIDVYSMYETRKFCFLLAKRILSKRFILLHLILLRLQKVKIASIGHWSFSGDVALGLKWVERKRRVRSGKPISPPE